MSDADGKYSSSMRIYLTGQEFDLAHIDDVFQVICPIDGVGFDGEVDVILTRPGVSMGNTLGDGPHLYPLPEGAHRGTSRRVGVRESLDFA